MKSLFLLSLFSFCILSGNSQSWAEKIKLVASDRSTQSQLGWDIAISGDYAVVGSPLEGKDQSGENEVLEAGAAYVFKRDSRGNWNQAQKLVASDRNIRDYMGVHVSISGDYILLGSAQNNLDADGLNYILGTGAVYIFEKDQQDTWNEVQKIVASNRNENDFFGFDVFVHGNVAAIGASGRDFDAIGGDFLQAAGAVYIFERDAGGVWNETQNLVASDRISAAQFGQSLAMDNKHLLIGAPGDANNSGGGSGVRSAGAVYIFAKDSTNTWIESQKIVPVERNTRDFFGNALSMSGDFAIVGARGKDLDSLGADIVEFTGAAFMLERDANDTWNMVQKIVPADLEQNDYFGISVAIDGEYAIVGAEWEGEDALGTNSLDSAGSAYVFKRNDKGIWEEEQKIVPSDRDKNDYFGSVVAISGDQVFVGANGEDHDELGGNPLENAGSFYVFEKSLNTDISQENPMPSFILYPNPSQGRVRIEFEESQQRANILIRNMLGEVILAKKIREAQGYELHIEGPAGIYFVEIQLDGGRSGFVKVVID